jgi:molybdenum cofactor biosynthesis enzyme
MRLMSDLSHFDSAGSPRMVDVTAKPETKRIARAHAFVAMSAGVIARGSMVTPRAIRSKSRA